MDETELVLTSKQRAVLFYMTKNVDMVLTRSQILDAVWGVDNLNVTDASVNSAIHSVRKRIGEKYRDLIDSFYCEGYRLNPKPYLKIIK